MQSTKEICVRIWSVTCTTASNIASSYVDYSTLFKVRYACLH